MKKSTNGKTELTSALLAGTTEHTEQTQETPFGITNVKPPRKRRSFKPSEKSIAVDEQPGLMVPPLGNGVRASNHFMDNLTYTGGLQPGQIEIRASDDNFQNKLLANWQNKEMIWCYQTLNTLCCMLKAASVLGSICLVAEDWKMIESDEIGIVRLKGTDFSVVPSGNYCFSVPLTSFVTKASRQELESGKVLQGGPLKIFYVRPQECMVMSKNGQTVLCMPGYHFIDDKDLIFSGTVTQARKNINLTDTNPVVDLGQYNMFYVRPQETFFLQHDDRLLNLSGPGRFIRCVNDTQIVGKISALEQRIDPKSEKVITADPFEVNVNFTLSFHVEDATLAYTKAQTMERLRNLVAQRSQAAVNAAVSRTHLTPRHVELKGEAPTYRQSHEPSEAVRDNAPILRQTDREIFEDESGAFLEAIRIEAFDKLKSSLAELGVIIDSFALMEFDLPVEAVEILSVTVKTNAETVRSLQIAKMRAETQKIGAEADATARAIDADSKSQAYQQLQTVHPDLPVIIEGGAQYRHVFANLPGDSQVVVGELSMAQLMMRQNGPLNSRGPAPAARQLIRDENAEHTTQAQLH